MSRHFQPLPLSSEAFTCMPHLLVAALQLHPELLSSTLAHKTLLLGMSAHPSP